jgi:hypothetical protein
VVDRRGHISISILPTDSVDDCWVECDDPYAESQLILNLETNFARECCDDAEKTHSVYRNNLHCFLIFQLPKFTYRAIPVTRR